CLTTQAAEKVYRSLSDETRISARLSGQGAARLREQARERLRSVAAWAPEAERHEAWALEHRADELERQAALDDLEAERQIGAALALDPGSPEAHAALAAHHRAAHAGAVATGRLDLAARSLAEVEAHTAPLPVHHPKRAELAAWVRGDAWLSLTTDPAGAEVVAEAQVPRDRRLVPGEVRPLGRTPLVDVAVPFGSWILRISSPGRPEVTLPVWLDRGATWDHRPPGGDSPAPVRLPREVPPGAVYVPAGWWIGGGSVDRPRRRLWGDGLFVQRFPVTMDAVAQWLNELLDAGRVDEALRHAPRAPLGRHGDDGPLVLARDPRGRFVTGQPDPDGDPIWGDYPAFAVDWAGAVAYAEWWRQRTGAQWRLPTELEWEKAARGVDGRIRAWGDPPDPSRCNCRDSHPDGPRPARVDSFPLDVSPYGVRGVTGNVRDWTSSPVTVGWGELGDRVPEGPVAPVRPSSGHVVGRGGAWPTSAGSVDLVTPYDDRVDFRHPAVAFRLVCSAG
ncbi:MAG: SUMF1/EgtB/PvdO family nonheme iron enzyme, partial [Myxococcota bacterium]